MIGRKYKITSYQCLLNTLYICRTFQMILFQNLSTRKSGFDTIRHRYKEILLVNRHGFHITLIEQVILIQKFIGSLFCHLVCNLRTSLTPGEPGQMLDYRRQVLRDLANLKSLLFSILDHLQDTRSQGCEDDAAVCESDPKESASFVSLVTTLFSFICTSPRNKKIKQYNQ